ncbi:Argininosuccinate lyase [Variovorax sp. SRS16]|uniref:Bug family tripartite tricarboxylate transporter substrate binding protein n=1 Tax=Variovorax sp. SRS16 TaxID=282217 RepID=UPI001318B3F7|nr:tripartite tricarboxylate transporter substrate binding protein [Variovorax sp. SRS16]VTU23866.1 Argininosuccinate lyase [Variovorax sp. SRS16]
MRKLHHFIAGLLLAAGTLSAFADAYPSKAIKVIVPYAVGQGTDIVARFVADALGKELKQAVYIENKPGANGNVGAQFAAHAPADGYTLMVGTNATNAANAFIYANPGYEAEDFEAIGMIGILPLVYVANNASSVNDIQDLIRAARAKPNALNTAVSTTTCRTAHELFKSLAQAPMFPVDFKGSGQALTAVIGGQVEFMVDTITSLRAAITSNQVKALGVTSATQSKLLPGVKSLAEQGVKGYELVGWTVLYTPKGVPAEVSHTLSAALDKVLARSDVQDKLLQFGIEPQKKSAEELKAFAASEKEKWGRLITAAGLKAN